MGMVMLRFPEQTCRDIRWITTLNQNIAQGVLSRSACWQRNVFINELVLNLLFYGKAEHCILMKAILSA